MRLAARLVGSSLILLVIIAVLKTCGIAVVLLVGMITVNHLRRNEMVHAS